ncbi:MAG: peptidoglycan-associated lipoprotein Pal [Pacificimonas sp.]|jgi:peptidoglycan-associated lipoprotein|nr:peptidoglycan-associated lipoprotein Pal [Pacificimonas sp.]
MKTAISRTLLIGLLVTATACARNDEELPPPPPPQDPVQQSQTQTPTPTPNVRDTVIPGSMADFMRQAGADRVFFALDSSTLDAEARDTLRRQAAWLDQYENVRITVEGHADERGTREYNLALGERRANAAATYLQQQGVDSDRITTISYGKERPAVEGSSESAWAQNRRAVTVLSGAAAS